MALVVLACLLCNAYAWRERSLSAQFHRHSHAKGATSSVQASGLSRRVSAGMRQERSKLVPLQLAKLLAVGARNDVAERSMTAFSHSYGFARSNRLAGQAIRAKMKASEPRGRNEAAARSKPPLPAAGSPSDELAVFILLFLATVNQWARALVFYTVDFKTPKTDEAVRLFMNVDVGFDEAQYGLLASIGFSLFFSLTSLIAGGLVDRTDARNLLTGTSVVWSGATIGQGLSHSFSEVLGARALSGIGQAFTNPTSYTILGRLYPKDRSASVNGLYAASIYFGGGLAALSVLFDQQIGWRDLYLVAGATGILASGAAQALVPPLPPQEGKSEAGSRTQADDDRSQGLEASARALQQLVSDPVAALLLLASTLRFLAGFSIAVWIVPFYRQIFPQSIGAEFAFIKAAVNGIGGSISATGGGILADKLGAKQKRFQLWVPAAGSLLAIPCWLGTLNAPSIELSLGALFLEYLFAECWIGPTVAELQAAAPPSAQGLTTGVFSCLTFVGNLAPFLIGLATQSGTSDLTSLLSNSVPILYAGSAAAFLIAGQLAQEQQGVKEQSS